MSTPRKPRWGRILATTFGLGLVVGVPVALAAGDGFGGPGFGPGCHRGGPESAEQLRDMMGFGADRALDKVDATDDQRADVEAVLDGLAPQLYALRAEHESIRSQVQAALTGPTVDRAALEEARQDGLALADKASALMMDGLADAAEALEAGQRQELADAWRAFHE